MTISPVLFALLGFLLTALLALLAGGVAWGRVQAVLEQLRSDYRDLREELRRGAVDGAELAVQRQRLADHDAEIKSTRDRLHKIESHAARLDAELAAVRSTAERAHDDARAAASATHHPHP